MWVITTRGFYSVVAHVDDPTRVLVRARAREDLVALSDLVSTLPIVETPDADYRWRATVDRAAWAAAVARMAEEVDYPNFKSAVAERQGVGASRAVARRVGDATSASGMNGQTARGADDHPR